MKKTTLLAILLVVVAVVIFYLVSRQTAPMDQPAGDDSAGTMLRIGDNGIYVSEQLPGASVNINLAVLKNGGFVVVHEAVDGKPGIILGSSELLASGQSDKVLVNLSRSVADKDILFAMLHSDNGDGKFNPADDVPVKDEQDNIIMTEFSISATATEPSVISL